MLSRVADSLYWMSRHIERAETLARLVEVNLQLILDMPSHQAQQLEKNCFPLVASLGDEADYLKRHRKRDCGLVAEYLVFDRANPNSVVSCLAAARENGRGVREQMSSEMWEHLNRTYLWMTSKTAFQLYERNSYEFFQKVRQSAYLFAGITDSSMPHGEGWDFVQVGKYLERADKTTRFLDEKFHLIQALEEPIPGLESMQWMAVLRTCSARQAYQRTYAAAVVPSKVINLLLLNPAFPRSVRFCLMRLDESVRRIGGVPPGEYLHQAERLSGRLLAEVSFSSVEEYEARGLHEAMDDLQVRFNEIGEAIFETYIYRELPPETGRKRERVVPVAEQ